ncbi:hypothetical protein BRCON_2265 [Candidatus Sumerlaea chitinivorans]|uniref:Uncharacterized protein n=1 Tax=Sumerlaea chitinivorans TaxID=2250252 RepID=A0A2Z4Y8P2_SUMC1|nr:hypothetical protein BRCON_2265 [Candidatus Sumerlaea chitinivorans]
MALGDLTLCDIVIQRWCILLVPDDQPMGTMGEGKRGKFLLI